MKFKQFTNPKLTNVLSIFPEKKRKFLVIQPKMLFDVIYSSN